MGSTSHNWTKLRWALIPFAAAALTLAVLHRAHPVQADQAPPPTIKTLKLGEARPGTLYSMTLAVKDPTQLQGANAVLATIKDAQGVIDSKWLHTADLDFYLTLRPRAAGPVTVTLSSTTPAPEITTTLHKILQAPALPTETPGAIAAAPNNTWQTAQPIEFGQTIYGSDDERPYAPSRNEDGYAAMVKGFQWFKFTFKEPKPRLVYFTLNVTDRDVPLDVDIFEPGKDDVIPYNKGEFVYQVEATQNYPGLYKFRTRILEPNHDYYIRVAGNHPAYQLHTSDFPIPPYTDPHQAVRAGMDFLVNMGDSWLSNTPRRGAVALRTTMQHSETQLCIACHPAQFTTRGYLTAVHNGYAPTQRPQLEFLADRLYNNARPLYGEPNTNWVRVIYTARTVSSRLPLLVNQFEQNVTHDKPRPNFAIPYAEYLKIHYKGLKEMPGDEADGCEPDVSPFEIATQSWQTFDMVYKQTKDEQWRAERDHVETLALSDAPKNMIDLNWKIMLLATIDRAKYQSQLDQLIAQLYEYETPQGAWPYPFDKKAKTADFISYNAVLAVAMAGRRPETDDHLAVAVKAMLAAQRQEGSWEGDPVYQGFNTPFRATQFAVMALSTLYPGTTQAKNWDAAYPAPPTRLAKKNLPLLLSQLDQYWDPAPGPVLKQIREVLLKSDQPLAREAAARAIGHMADPGSLPALMQALGDQTKMVQTSAAYAVRMILSRRQDVAPEGRKLLIAALASPTPRTRWGAARVFNQHFRDLTGDKDLLAALERTVNDPVPFVRFEAASGLWRWYYWQVNQPEMRRTTLETLATRMNVETDAMVRRGLEESIYDLLDENTGYLTAWVRASAEDDDKKRIGNGYESVVRDQAQVLAKVLREGTPSGREGILNALWDFHIRHYALPPLKENTVSIGLPAVLTKYVSGVPDLHRPGYEYPPYREAVDFKYDVHNGFFQTRIGNDSDLIHFFKSSGPELEEALLACLKDANDTMKIEVLKAGSTLSGAADERFTLAALTLSEDSSPEVRQTVRYVYEEEQRGALNLDPPPAAQEDVSSRPKRSEVEGPAVPPTTRADISWWLAVSERTKLLLSSTTRSVPQVSLLRPGIPATDPEGEHQLSTLSSRAEPRDLQFYFTSNNAIASPPQKELSSRPERTQISYLATFPTATYVPFLQRKPQEAGQSHQASLEIWGSEAEGLAVPAPDPRLVTKIVEILQHGNPDSQAVVFPMLATLPNESPWTTQPEVLSALRTLLEQQPRPANYAQVLNAASSFKTLMRETNLQQQVLEGLNDPNPEVQRAAIRVSLEHFLADPQTEPLVKTSFAHLDPSATSILLEEVGDPKFMNRHAGVSGGAISQDQAYFLNKNLVAIKRPTDLLDNPLVLSTVLASLHNPDNNVRAAGLDTLRKVKGVEQRPEFHAAMEQLQNDNNPRLKLIAASVLQGKKLSEALKDVQPGSVLDFNYFVAKIEPILATQGADGKACVFCHASHVIFKLRPPNDQGVFSDQDSEDNYKYAMHVVDINDPTKSLILIKPTRPTDSAGNVGDYLATHNGGQRWHGNEQSWQYRTILEWIRGGRLETAVVAK
jgi:HEAT repeat protein